MTKKLGKALIKNRFKSAKIINPDGSLRHTVNEQEINMNSITHENDLEAFLASATLAGTDFTAQKLNVLVVSNNHFESIQEQQLKYEINQKHKHLLTIPRRPHWDSSTTAEQLKVRENHSFLEWRRKLVELEEEKGLLLTPFERNLEIWRQLWRVVERSVVIVQIVDARHPLFFHCPDLNTYVQDLGKKNLLLINKADLLTTKQRLQWAKYFKDNGIAFIFFSAAMAKQKLEDEQENEKYATQINTVTQQDIPKEAQIMEALDFVDFLTDFSANSSVDTDKTKKTIIGFVGYPNVGKSSTLNSLVGAKKVAVGSTPGKTKHFQTIHISDQMILCDCPGLVFPSFATTKAEMVVNGVLPIDQLREIYSPISLVCQRIPKAYLEAVYGIEIKTRDSEGELISRAPTATELLQSFAIARGFTKSSQGNPDEARASRHILKDYVNGKLLYVDPPPGVDPTIFNSEIYQGENLVQRSKKVDAKLLSTIQAKEKIEKQPIVTVNRQFDSDFFSQKNIKAKTLGSDSQNDFTRPVFHYEKNAQVIGDKKHKKDKRKKNRTQWTKLDD